MFVASGSAGEVSPKDPSKTVAKNIVGGSGPPGRKGKDMAVKGLGKDKDYFCKGGKWQDDWGKGGDFQQVSW